MLKFLNNKVNSTSSTNNIQFEHPESMEDMSRLLALKTPVFFYKHSRSGCSVSLFVMRRLNGVKVHLRETWAHIDGLAQRYSNFTLAETKNIRHESPQLIIWNNGQIAAHASNDRVNAQTVNESRKAYHLAEQE